MSNQTPSNSFYHIWTFVGGIGASILFGYILITFKSQSGVLIQAYPSQASWQLVLAILMFSYYLGIAKSEDYSPAVFMIGFMAGAISFGTYYWLTESFTPITLLGMAGAVILGLYLGSVRPIFDNNTLDSAIKYLLNFFGWVFQGFSILGSINFNLVFPPATFPINSTAVIHPLTLLLTSL